jgi:hypothetical protein
LGKNKGPSRGKFHKFYTRRLIHGNEEEGHQKGCQKEKEVSDPGEAIWPRSFFVKTRASALW